MYEVGYPTSMLQYPDRIALALAALMLSRLGIATNKCSLVRCLHLYTPSLFISTHYCYVTEQNMSQHLPGA